MSFAELNPPYATIVADPPWHYDERVIEYGRGAARSAPMPYVAGRPEVLVERSRRSTWSSDARARETGE